MYWFLIKTLWIVFSWQPNANASFDHSIMIKIALLNVSGKKNFNLKIESSKSSWKSESFFEWFLFSPSAPCMFLKIKFNLKKPIQVQRMVYMHEPRKKKRFEKKWWPYVIRLKSSLRFLHAMRSFWSLMYISSVFSCIYPVKYSPPPVLSRKKSISKRATAAVYISRIYDALLSYNRVCGIFGSKFTLILMDQFS